MKDVHVEASLAHLAVGRGRIPVSYRNRNARKPLKDWYPELIFVCVTPALTSALGSLWNSDVRKNRHFATT